MLSSHHVSVLLFESFQLLSMTTLRNGDGGVTYLILMFSIPNYYNI